MIDALRRSGGFVSVAAQALGCDRVTVHRYINEFPTVKAAYEETNETNLDVAEAMLMKQVREGDPGQVRFYLRTKGRSRGYGDRLALDFDPTALTDEQLAAIAAGKDPDRATGAHPA